MTATAAAATIAGSTTLCADWTEFVEARRRTDQAISDWAGDLDPGWLEGDLTWHSGSLGRDVTRPRALLVVHLFNHQTHHRGQLHAALTRAGIETAPTDLPFMPTHD